MPQQYLYSESETMSTDDDTAEFVHYRKYKYGRSYQLSVNLLEDMGKAEVENKPLLNNCCVIGDEAQPLLRQQEQVDEIRGLRCFLATRKKVTTKSWTALRALREFR